MKYKIIFDNGKPYVDTVETDKELKHKLKDFYKENNGFTFDAEIYQFEYNPLTKELEEVNITETQFIEEIISDIIGEKTK